MNRFIQQRHRQQQSSKCMFYNTHHQHVASSVEQPQVQQMQTSPINNLFGQLQSFIQQQLHSTISLANKNNNNNKNKNKNMLSFRQQQRIHSAQTYMDARLSGRNDEILQLVSDNVILTSSRDGRFEGKPSLKQYIGRVKASGKWHKAKWNNSLDVAEVEGNVKILMVNIPVLAQFSFDNRGKISTINVGTKKKLTPSMPTTKSTTP